ncbi:response regulator [Pseudacidovorax intermedius]|uniref:Chemotaxis protein CheY n=1 Tax=Pseudacidovorax intermedius TaxID=433924 RepID=A0A147H0W5_9BURK|nr:response regulator [Pseudacidovorax intermedius]KTT23472.1 chemotaxis protein CheY [Pseudacidovorax intermedius]
MTIRSVLVVDDSRTELMFLSDVLERNGYAVRTAESADAAMRHLEVGLPDLILMDIVMPGQNGFQFTRSLMRDPRFAQVPVILCSSKGQETDRVWGLRQGARDYIVKPVQPDDLLARIRALG